MKSKIAAAAGANPFEAWPVPSVVPAPLKYRVKGPEKPAVYSDTTDADALLKLSSKALSLGKMLQDR